MDVHFFIPLSLSLPPSLIFNFLRISLSCIISQPSSTSFMVFWVESANTHPLSISLTIHMLTFNPHSASTHLSRSYTLSLQPETRLQRLGCMEKSPLSRFSHSGMLFFHDMVFPKLVEVQWRNWVAYCSVHTKEKRGIKRRKSRERERGRAHLRVPCLFFCNPVPESV
ncbi:hypothetical protein BO82DRAFT_211963 [Aspergillus uvarum CBS 121591]|uniref:Uncharacterized protein n=1 Tax=Aspergillus uvarum CBS 121591 TaxID=1448315 RepID=A0A319DA46_9EURO|nr:hypothetical protein BO82DRAFT_211963 [Aspergillus uvarum CBS 121591]PYH84868.1 hypothetical protein BO82DRAFT_211963 [Aspergillus uvarum CBS 121591]